MPIYEYKCRKCGEGFEELVRNAAHEQELTCVACSSSKIERQLSVPSAPPTSAPSCSSPLPTAGCGQCGTGMSQCPFQG